MVLLRRIVIFIPSVFLAVTLAGESLSWARQDHVPGSRYTSGRGAAMGDAVLPLVDDGASGLFYNPAAIPRARHAQFEPLNIAIQSNSDYISILNRNFYKVLTLSKYAPTLGGYPEYAPGISGAIFPNFTMRGFAIGMLMQDQFWAQYDTTANTIHYRSLYQFIPSLGVGVPLASGVVRLGYSLQWIHQTSGDITVAADSAEVGWNQGLAEGSGFSHNLAIALSLPVTYLPAVTVVARNVLGTKFTSASLVRVGRNVSGRPADEPMSIDVAGSISPKTGGGGVFNLVLNYRDVLDSCDESIFGRLALGAEFSFRNQFFLRGGWSGGYPSAGVGLSKKSGELSLSWFSEEIGTAYRERRDTRYLLQYQIRAF